MGHTTVRINDTTHAVLRELAETAGKPMLAVLEEAVETLRRQRFLEQVNEAYASLRADAKAWKAIEEERRGWDATLLDGLAVREGRASYDPRKKRRGRRRE